MRISLRNGSSCTLSVPRNLLVACRLASRRRSFGSLSVHRDFPIVPILLPVASWTRRFFTPFVCQEPHSSMWITLQEASFCSLSVHRNILLPSGLASTRCHSAVFPCYRSTSGRPASPRAARVRGGLGEREREKIGRASCRERV